MMKDKLLTKQEVLKYLNISRRTFENLVKEHNLPVIKITPYKRYVRLSHLDEYLDSRTKNKPQETTSEPTTSPPEFKWKRIWGKEE